MKKYTFLSENISPTKILLHGAAGTIIGSSVLSSLTYIYNKMKGSKYHERVKEDYLLKWKKELLDLYDQRDYIFENHDNPYSVLSASGILDKIEKLETLIKSLKNCETPEELKKKIIKMRTKKAAKTGAVAGGAIGAIGNALIQKYGHKIFKKSK